MFKRFQPLTIDDAEFGRLTFMRIKGDPPKSYWEAEYVFAPTGAVVSAGLQGTDEGPIPAAREFYRHMEDRFQDTLKAVRPSLEQAFAEWLGRPLGANLWDDLVLAGFDVEDPPANPRRWDVMFEATGDKWLAFTVPFIGDTIQPVVVDS
jgi:hypothetical protein